MSQPQSPPQWYPAQPQKQGLSTGAIVAIVVAVVVVVIIVGAIIVGAYFVGVQQSANLSRPNVAITNEHSTYYDCSLSYPSTSRWYFDATLVNTGGAAYAQIGYDVNGQQVTWNTYYIPANSQLPVSESVTVNTCYGSTTPTYAIVLLSERLA